MVVVTVEGNVQDLTVFQDDRRLFPAVFPARIVHVPGHSVGIDLSKDAVFFQFGDFPGEYFFAFTGRPVIWIIRIVGIVMPPVPVQSDRQAGFFCEPDDRIADFVRPAAVPEPHGGIPQRIDMFFCLPVFPGVPGETAVTLRRIEPAARELFQNDRIRNGTGADRFFFLREIKRNRRFEVIPFPADLDVFEIMLLIGQHDQNIPAGAETGGHLEREKRTGERSILRPVPDRPGHETGRFRKQHSQVGRSEIPDGKLDFADLQPGGTFIKRQMETGIIPAEQNFHASGALPAAGVFRLFRHGRIRGGKNAFLSVRKMAFQTPGRFDSRYCRQFHFCSQLLF